MEGRLGRALVALEAIGGAARLRRRTKSLSTAARAARWLQPSLCIRKFCGLAETLLSEMIGLEVQEQCDRNGPPRCRFEVIGSENGKE